jgi:hypothetical protein
VRLSDELVDYVLEDLTISRDEKRQLWKALYTAQIHPVDNKVLVLYFDRWKLPSICLMTAKTVIRGVFIGNSVITFYIDTGEKIMSKADGSTLIDYRKV